MRAVCVFAVLLVLGASAQEQAGFGSFFSGLTKVVSKVAPIAIKAAPAVTGIVQGSIALHQNKASPQEILQHSLNSAQALHQAIRNEESGFGSFLKKVGGVVKKVAPVVAPIAKQVGNQVLASKGVPIQFEESGFDFGSLFNKAITTGIKLAPTVGGIVQGSIALHQNKGSPQEILQHSLNSAGALFGALRNEESSFGSFFKKVTGVVQKVAPVVKQALPIVKPFAQQMLASKGIQMAEESSFSSFLSKITPIIKKGVEITKQVAPIVAPVVKDVVKSSIELHHSKPNQGQIMAHIFDTVKKAGGVAKEVAPVVIQNIQKN